MFNRYLIFWFIYSFFGWVIDSAYSSFVLQKLFAGGLFISLQLPIPLAPIYGFGALALIISYEHIKDWHILIRYFYCCFLLAFIELGGGLWTELMLDRRVWNYSDSFLNIAGYTDLTHALVWGLIGVIIMEKIQPRLEKKLSIN